MPYPTVAAAEQAALEGEVSDLDTQHCRDIQQFLVSSPAKTPDHGQSQDASIRAAEVDRDENSEEEGEDDGEVDEGEGDEDEDGQSDLPADSQSAFAEDPSIPQLIQNLSQAEDRVPAEVDVAKPAIVAHTHFRRDSKGKLKAYAAREETRHPDFEARFRTAIEETQRGMQMEDLTQKSSMSLTQENPAEAYARFDIQDLIREDCPSTADTDNGEGHNALPTAQNSASTKKQHHSVHTESTAHTYGENDTGHVNIMYDPDVVDEDMVDGDFSQSQDESFAAQAFSTQFGAPSYEPETPAAPVNPFSQKGSVLKGPELFRATQPSSIARYASPTSTRPSPADPYNDFSSPEKPAKRQRITSSPLGRLQDNYPQSSLVATTRELLAADIPDNAIPRTSGVQSFPSSRLNSSPEPRLSYKSSKASQELRRNRHSVSSSPNLDEFEFDEVINGRERKRSRETMIKRELSAVAIPTKRLPTPSRPPSSESPAVEVPSTGRRRSIQEEYLAQCDGFDARDTQQDIQQDDDVVADSQDPSARNRVASQRSRTSLQKGHSFAPNSSFKGGTIAETPCKPRNLSEDTEEPATSPILEEQTFLEQSSPLVKASQPIEDEIDPLPAEPTLPSEEPSGHRGGSQTFIPAAIPLESDRTVLETSPAEEQQVQEEQVENKPRVQEGAAELAERFTPMGEIAHISFQQDSQPVADYPGLTQDMDFEMAVNLISPKKHVHRPSSLRQTELSSVASSPLSPPPASDDSMRQPAKLPEVLPFVSPQDRPKVTFQNPSPNSDGGVLPTMAIDEPDGVSPIAKAVDERAAGEVDSSDRETRHSAPETTGTDTDDKPDAVDEEVSSTTDELAPFAPETEEPHAARPTAKKGKPRKKSVYSRKSSNRSTTSQPKSQTTNLRKETSTAPTPTQSPRPDLPTAERSVTRSQAVQERPTKQSTPVPVAKRSMTRSLRVTPVEDAAGPISARSSKRKAMANLREDSEDPLAAPASATKQGRSSKSVSGLFDKMAFAVSYVKNDQERNNVHKLIQDHGGRLLDDGFDALFNVIPKTADQDAELTLSDLASSLGFTALIADEHSRKNKFMQALALGLPCISGRWILQCVAKMAIVEWQPYLLSAGQSSFLGNAVRSRVLTPYPAPDAVFAGIFSGRERLLEGKSVLLVTGKGKTEEMRKAYVFLTRALGPARIGQAVDFQQARKRLTETEGTDQAYDLLYVEKDEKTADDVVFGTGRTAKTSKKRKRVSEPAPVDSPAPKRVRIIVDETMIQSLILGQLLEED